VREDDIDVSDMTEELMEEVGMDIFDGCDSNDDVILGEQAQRGDNIDGSVFAKASHKDITCVTYYCANNCDDSCGQLPSSLALPHNESSPFLNVSRWPMRLLDRLHDNQARKRPSFFRILSSFSMLSLGGTPPISCSSGRSSFDR